MGEYLSVTIYKEVKPITPFTNRFDRMVQELYKARNDRQEIERIYRKNDFILPNGNVFDLQMRFKEFDEGLFQTNSGVWGSKELPNLQLYYKFEFHNFWLTLLKPTEMSMDQHDVLHARLSGKDVHFRLFQIKRRNSHFETSELYQYFTTNLDRHTPNLKTIIKDQDIIEIQLGHIYHTEEPISYRETARKEITKQRKEIATNLFVPHWV